MDFFTLPFKNYINFSGRASRYEYWGFSLTNLFILLVLKFYVSEISFALYALITLLPILAVSVRRLHDTNKTGWFIFLSLIPFIGALILFFFYISPSQMVENQYGPEPVV